MLSCILRVFNVRQTEKDADQWFFKYNTRQNMYFLIKKSSDIEYNITNQCYINNEGKLYISLIEGKSFI